jgi:hypothetical protein
MFSAALKQLSRRQQRASAKPLSSGPSTASASDARHPLSKTTAFIVCDVSPQGLSAVSAPLGSLFGGDRRGNAVVDAGGTEGKAGEKLGKNSPALQKVEQKYGRAGGDTALHPAPKSNNGRLATRPAMTLQGKSLTSDKIKR